MSATALRIRVVAPSIREDFPRGAAPFVACAALEAFAAGILLMGTPLSPVLEGLAAGVAHGAAALLLSGAVRARPGRPWLGVACLVAVPLVGIAVAIAAHATSGRGAAARRRRRTARRQPALARSALQRLGGALSPCDALNWGDEEQRRAALSALSRRADPEAIALLRWAAAGRDPDLALSAALALDEIGERAERRVDPFRDAEVRSRAG